MATVYKVHPAIGVARVGDSREEFFVGPERVGEHPAPPGGFRDERGQVKRQAARFRVFAHHDDGAVTEVTAADAEITWTAHLVNSKAAFPNRGNVEPAADLTIDPGPRTVGRRNNREELTGGTIRFAGQPPAGVPLGELRTDDAGRLLVLGGHGRAASPAGDHLGNFWANPGWYDDVSDGPVSASITLRRTGETPPVVPAWVIVAPPKFAPGLDSPTTLYDRLLQRMVDLGLLPAPTTTSYTEDVYPILRRARDMHWVEAVFGAHQWPEPVTEQAQVEAIVQALSHGMPMLRGEDTMLTDVQREHMRRWQRGEHIADWAGEPGPRELSPDGLDRAALEACVGATLFPGIEAGGMPATSVPILDADYAEPFRLAPGLAPGSITAALALPWQADFNSCGDNWWPVARPNDVIIEAGSGIPVRWDRDIGSPEDMVANWHRLGFVVQRGEQYVEVERCEAASTTLLTRHLAFRTPAGPLGMAGETALAITFEVVSPAAELTLEYAPGGAPAHPQLVPATIAVTVGPTEPNAVATARLWLVHRGADKPSAIPTQTLTVREPVSGQTWRVTVDAETVARPTTATALVLDRCADVAGDRGDGQGRNVALREAANVIADLMLPGDGLGVVGYDEQAHEPGQVRALGEGGPADPARAAARDLAGRGTLDPAGPADAGQLFAGAPFDERALVVLTGSGYQPPWLTGTRARVHAVGVGRPHELGLPALLAAAGNTGGTLLVTGPVTRRTRFLPQRHALRVLSGISGTETVLDVDGELAGGVVHRIPFQLSDADAGIDVVLLTPRPAEVDFRVRTPNGLLLEPWRARDEPAMRFEFGDGLAYFRLVLPAQLRDGRFDHAGTWHVMLAEGEPRLAADPAADDGVDLSMLADRPVRDTAGAAPRYGVVVQSYSAVALTAQVRQPWPEPGAEATVTARLTESGLPVGGDPYVWLDLTEPDGTATSMRLEREGTGFAATFRTGAAGVYQARVRARGRTRRALPFRRERTITVPVWHRAP